MMDSGYHRYKLCSKEISIDIPGRAECGYDSREGGAAVEIIVKIQAIVICVISILRTSIITNI